VRTLKVSEVVPASTPSGLSLPSAGGKSQSPGVI
jgi:hypothetical protein